MILTIDIRAQNVYIGHGNNKAHCCGMAEAFNFISEKFAEDRDLRVKVASPDPKIMIRRYVDKKISAVQLNYLIKIIAERSERKAYINIMCQWLKENSIKWERI